MLYRAASIPAQSRTWNLDAARIKLDSRELDPLQRVTPNDNSHATLCVASSRAAHLLAYQIGLSLELRQYDG